MKLSFHTCGLEWWSLEDAINELADIGYDACGPILAPGGHVDPEKITSSEIERYKQLAADRNLAISTLNPWKIGGFATKVERARRSASSGGPSTWPPSSAPAA